MTDSNSAIDALSLLVWATFLPLVIVLVMRSRSHHEDPPMEKHNDTAAHTAANGDKDPTP